MPWDYTKKAYKKQANADPRWHLERLINYGLAKEKLNKNTLKQLLPQLHIPELRRKLLKLLLK